MGLEVGPHRIEGVLHTGGQIVGVQAMEDEQAAHQLVVDDFCDEWRGFGVDEDLEDPVESTAVELCYQA